MFIFVARSPDPARKPALLAEIVEFLLDKPLATLSFRTLAVGLGVSTYTLVYHFGSRAQLMREIMAAVTERQDAVVPDVEHETGDMETHIANIRRSWRLGLDARSRQLQRLEIEAAMFEAREDPLTATSVRVFARWHEVGVSALQKMGLDLADAELEARLMVDTIYGLQYDLIVSRDEARATAAFERALAAYEARIRVLIADVVV